MTALAKSLFSLTLAGMFMSFSSMSWAQSQSHPTCVDQAGSTTEIDQCGASLIKHLEEKIENDYRRLNEKFTDNQKMRDMLQASRESWNVYRNNQCILEASATTGQYVVKPLSLEAHRAYLKCMLRTFGEMKTTLERY